MPSEKVSLTLDEELVAEARGQVGGRGLSSYVNEALRLKLQRDRLRKLLDEMEQEVGPIDPRIREEVRRKWRQGEARAPKRRTA